MVYSGIMIPHRGGFVKDFSENFRETLCRARERVLGIRKHGRNLPTWIPNGVQALRETDMVTKKQYMMVLPHTMTRGRIELPLPP